MDETGICGRNKEIEQIKSFISSKLDTRTSGILYLTGPPGTGKTMSVKYILDHCIDKALPRININCLRSQSSKTILTKLCQLVDLDEFTKCKEADMISRLTKKFSQRTCGSYLIVLDEMDQLPKSKSADLLRTIFSWPSCSSSKLILIGIANTVNLTSRYQTLSHILGQDCTQVTRIVFRPYNSKDIIAILQFYLENDENLKGALIEPKALSLIAIKSAQTGDIRGAINALRSSIDDTKELKQQPVTPQKSLYPLTPPSTPPSTPQPASPCKEKTTNIASVLNSVKKRQRTTFCQDDKFPFGSQVILTCLQKLRSKTQNHMVDFKLLQTTVTNTLSKFGFSSSKDDYRAMLDNLELQGLIALKKGRPRERITLRASEEELTQLVQQRDTILSSIAL